MRGEEFQHQMALFQWIAVNRVKHPGLHMFFSTQNGMYTRSKAAAGKAKASGNKKGVPDIFCMFPASGRCGLMIELKANKGRISPEQSWWINNLNSVGYRAEFCYGWEAAASVICEYLNLDKKTCGIK